MSELPIRSNIQVTAQNRATTAHSKMQVIKRNGQCVAYNEDKIRVAISKAFLAVEGPSGLNSSRLHDQVKQLTDEVTSSFEASLALEGIVHIETIQDQVQLALMRHKKYEVASAYILYRDARRQARESTSPTPKETFPEFTFLLPNGQTQTLDFTRIKQRIIETCIGLTDANPELIFQQVQRNLYQNIPFSEIDKALIMSARALVEQDPDYSTVTARLLLHSLILEAKTCLGHTLDPQVLYSNTISTFNYKEYFPIYLAHGIELGRIDPSLQEFDLTALAQALQEERDQCFSYLSLQTLYDRYFLHQKEIRFELPQAFFMRIAMGLAKEEINKTERAIEFYHLLSSFDYMASTPTLFNAGTTRPQLSSCFLTTIPDDLAGIYSGLKDNALLSKFAGGLGNDWTPVRASGSVINGTNGKSQGVVPFLNVANASTVAVNQGGKRKGAVCAYLETWHLDIEEFLELRKNTGDDRRRTHDMNTANWIPDLFMKRVMTEQEWTLFSPEETPGLHDAYGQAFETLYEDYEAKALAGKIKNFKRISAVTLWKKMLTLLFETGHPWITFKDPCNLRSPQQHVGVIHSSNLCTEITLNTSAEEIAVCNLGSINLAQHLTEEGEINREKLRKTVFTAMRMLDNVIDINFYTVPQAEHSNLKHRPVGLGIMGLQDALFKKQLSFESNDTLVFSDLSMELISYYAIEASCELAKERGAYPSFEGSLWSQGILPIDSIEKLKTARGDYLDQDRSTTLDWEILRQKVKKHGLRNSNCLAIAPTATISNICNITPSIEPIYQNLFVKSNMSGEFTVINPYLVNDLKRLNLWDNVMINDLKYYDGSIQRIDRLPDELKARYATVFEIDPLWLIELASRRQKWLDQSQSLNLFIAGVSGKKLDTVYKRAWLKGLKTTYYLRTLGATHTEKATIERNKLNVVAITQKTQTSSQNASCPIPTGNPNDEICEVCQ